VRAIKSDKKKKKKRRKEGGKKWIFGNAKNKQNVKDVCLIVLGWGGETSPRSGEPGGRERKEDDLDCARLRLGRGTNWTL